MSYLEQYRPPGRSNRSGRTQADNDVFEGLPVKQWGQQYARVSLAPPASETQRGEDDKWAEPPMPRDYQLLQPWTQQLLRLARSGKVGTKRKQDSEGADEDKPEDEAAEEASKNGIDDRGYVAKKWKPVPEHLLVQEHKHFEFLAKRRRGLPSLYAPDQQDGAAVPMRRTKVSRSDNNGEIVVYEVLVPEGQSVEGEISATSELAEAAPVAAAPGTVIEGVGTANDEGVLVARLESSSASRRNRPPPKKKGGPGRGKKRVTFTNPDGSTYTTIVPNATKIVPQPGQIVKHVAKGEEANADITAEEAAAAKAARGDNGEGEGSGSEDGDDDGEDDDDREDGEVSDDDAPGTGAATPAKPTTPAKSTPTAPEQNGESEAMEDVRPTSPVEQTDIVEDKPVQVLPDDAHVEPTPEDNAVGRDVSSSPELPLAKRDRSRTESLADPPSVGQDDNPSAAPEIEAIDDIPAETESKAEAQPQIETEPEPERDDGDEDLLGNLEKHLESEKPEP